MHFNQTHSCLSAVAPVPAYNYSRPHRREGVLSSGAKGGGVRGFSWGPRVTRIRLHPLLEKKTVGPVWNYDLMGDLRDLRILHWLQLFGVKICLSSLRASATE